MPQAEHFEVLVVGSGAGGKLIAWHLAQSGQRTAVVERRWIGGSCPNIACMPTKNEISSARVAHLARHAAQYGTAAGPVAIDMGAVRKRKREMVERQVAGETVHRQVMYDACRIAPLADLAVDKMPAEEGEQQRVAATDLGRIGPVRRCGPKNDRLSVDVPRHQPSAGVRRELERSLLARDLYDVFWGGWHGAACSVCIAGKRRDRPGRVIGGRVGQQGRLHRFSGSILRGNPFGEIVTDTYRYIPTIMQA